MATSTNLGLYLPTREDYISVKRDLSDNYEIIDAAVGGNTQGIAQIQSETDIVINGATSTSNVTIGQFVTVRNSSITGIVDGVYKALANVTAGTSFVAANLQAVTGGALNKIVSDMDSMMQQQENDMDIVIRGNTASVNVAAGQFVTVRNSTIANISDGIYKAANNVSSGVAFTDADLDDISSGALNELVSDLATLNDHIATFNTSETEYGKWTDGTTLYRRVVSYSGAISMNTDTVIDTLQTGYKIKNMSAIVEAANAATFCGDGLMAWYVHADGKVHIDQSITNNSASYYVIMYYTK